MFHSGPLHGTISHLFEAEEDGTLFLWKFSAQEFSLSLIQTQTNTDFPLAYIVLEFALQNYVHESQNSEPSLDRQSDYNFVVQKSHAVMHPIALGKMLDIFLFFKRELEELSITKSKELENLEKLLTFTGESNVPQKNFFIDKSLTIFVQHIGLAIPLLEKSQKHEMSNPALLISALKLNMYLDKLSSFDAQVFDYTCQFVDNFDQGNDIHFFAKSHIVQNKVLLKYITSHANYENNDQISHAFVDSCIKGFELEIDSDFPRKS